MLQAIRDRAQGWIAWVIVILIAIPFAFWGIDSYLGFRSEPAVAEVNGQEITERDLDIQFQNFRGQLRERLGAAFRPELVDDTKLRKEVLDNLVRDAVLAQASADLGLAASAQEIRGAILSEPAFRRGGQFDKAAYERAVQLQGMVPKQFEERLRQRLVSTQLSRLVAATEFVTDAELAEAVRVLRQQRSVSYLTLPTSRFISDRPIPEPEVLAYYEAHQDLFHVPEQVRVAYLVVDADTLGAAVPVSEEELRALYDQQMERFRQPERRAVRHILVELPRGADETAQQAARQRAEQIRARIQGGEDFAAVAKEVSDDPGSAPQGGDLGMIERGMMDPAFEQAAFALPQGQLSELVRSAFGLHLLRVEQIVPEGVKPFAEVKAELTAEAQKKQVEGQYFEIAERLANLTYEHPDSLQPAAEALGLPIQNSDWLSRQGGQGVLAHPKVVAAAFAPDVLEQGNNTELLEPERETMQAVVLRVIERKDAATRPLQEVRGEIETAIRTEVARTAAAEAAAGMVNKLRGGTPLSEVAGSTPITNLGLIGREDAKVPQALRNLAFTMSRPKAGEASYADTSLANGDAAVVVLTEVKDGSLEALTPEARDQEKQRLARNLGRQYYDHLMADLVGRAKVTRHTPKRPAENP